MTMILDEPTTEAAIKARRAELGLNLFDEVWDGIYVVSPSPNNEHQELASSFQYILFSLISVPRLGVVCATLNVSDREQDWERNFRVPDLSVFLNGTKALNRKTHWVGGPDFAVEILSQNDRAYEKLDFYAKVGVRELLIVDRDPWSLELYRLVGASLEVVGHASIESGLRLESNVLPLFFRLIPGDDRPVIEVIHADGNRRWSI